VKGRPFTHPLIAHVLGEADAAALTRCWSDRASRLAKAFWPGPLTLVLERSPAVSAEFTGGADSVAIRAPAHPIARALLTELAEPIAAPSANRYQSISPTTAAHVVRSLGDGVGLVLDGGPCSGGIESTVVDLRGGAARVLRLGAVPVSMLRPFEPKLELVVSEEVSVAERRPSPGMDARHYAPHTTMLLASDREAALATAHSRSASGVRVGLVLRREIVPNERLVAEAARVISLGDEPVGYGRALYATLHILDAGQLDLIIVEPVPETDAWAAIADRLRRAGGGRA
jgi:L-threonylcarbamoyladenylate synthase